MRKIEVRYVEQTPLDVCLELWVRYLSRDDLGIHWRGRAVGLDGGSACDSEQLYDRLDNETGEAMDAMIGDLKLHHHWAIKRRCSVATVWTFPSLVFADVLIEAEEKLITAMKKNLATRNFFD